MVGEWLRPIPENFPELLKQHARWVMWLVDGTGNKAPRSVRRPEIQTKANLAINWGTFEAALAVAEGTTYGFGYVLGSVKDGPTFSGVDLDKCRDPVSGKIEDWAWRIIKDFNTYTEISPSGTGVKLFLLGCLPEDANQGKVYKVELYDHDRYFTITGHHLEGTPRTVEPREERLCALHQWLWSRDLVKIVKFFDMFISESADTVNMKCPWADKHTSGDKPQDTGLQLKDGHVVGFHCFHGGCRGKTLGDVRQFFGVANERGGALGFKTNGKDVVLKDSPFNIRRAVDLLKRHLSYNTFSQKIMVTDASDRPPVVLTDDIRDDMLYAIEKEYGFQPSDQQFRGVLRNYALDRAYHPVKDYLAGLVWDGVSRVDGWLTRYAGADDTDYVRAVGALVLVAAVRRIRQPGCKFDELLVLESVTGKSKSTALEVLCGNREWFSDDLHLGIHSKEVIEQTSGKWIVEVAELSGYKDTQVERLKAFLSRGEDTARKAYGHEAESIRRQFIMVGTTNSHFYLKDTTGNRRFWPVNIKEFDIQMLGRDRDQLWAEAALRESQGESIRMNRDLWDKASEEQESRREVDPWEGVLSKLFVGRRVRYRVSTEELFQEVGVSVDRQDRTLMSRLSAIMVNALGFHRMTIMARKHENDDAAQSKRLLNREFQDKNIPFGPRDIELAARYATSRVGARIWGWGREELETSLLSGEDGSETRE